MNNLNGETFQLFYNKLLNGKNSLYEPNMEACYMIKKSNEICAKNNIVALHNFGIDKRNTMDVKHCGEGTKTQIKVARVKPYAVMKMDEKSVYVDLATNEILTFLKLKKIDEPIVVKYLGGVVCGNEVYYHIQKMFGNAMYSYTKLIGRMTEDKYVTLLMKRMFDILSKTTPRLCHGSCTLENVFVFLKNDKIVFKLGNCSNGIMKLKKKIVSNHKKLQILKMNEGRGFVSLEERVKVRTIEKARNMIASMYVSGIKMVDVYILIASICLHKSFHRYIVEMHENKEDIRYKLQNLFDVNQLMLIKGRIIKFNKRKINATLIDCVNFWTLPFSDGSFVRMQKNVLKKYVEVN